MKLTLGKKKKKKWGLELAMGTAFASLYITPAACDLPDHLCSVFVRNLCKS